MTVKMATHCALLWACTMHAAADPLDFVHDSRCRSVVSALESPCRVKEVSRLHLQYARYAIGEHPGFSDLLSELKADESTPDWMQAEVRLLELHRAAENGDVELGTKALEELLHYQFLSPRCLQRRDALAIRAFRRLFLGARQGAAWKTDGCLNAVLRDATPSLGPLYLFLLQQRAMGPVDKDRKRTVFLPPANRKLDGEIKRLAALTEWCRYLQFRSFSETMKLQEMHEQATAYWGAYGSAGTYSQEICYRMLHAIRYSKERGINKGAPLSSDHWLALSREKTRCLTKAPWILRIEEEFGGKSIGNGEK